MSKKLKRLFKLFVIMIMACTIVISPIVNADSGWDSDYDSGGSWDSGGSDWSSGSSWDSDYSGSSSSGDVDSPILGLIIFIIIVVAAVGEIRKKKGNYLVVKTQKHSYNDITQEHLSTVMPDANLADLKKLVFENFVDIQNAWSEFDYDKLRELCTDELYNSYKSQLETLKLKNGKNIMNDFSQNCTGIIDINNVNGDIVLTAFLSVSFYDYVINTISNKVTRGNKFQKITNNYVLTFVIKSDYDSEKEEKCPNCGAKIKHVTSGKCEYCNSTIVKKASKFVLSKKTNVNK